MAGVSCAGVDSLCRPNPGGLHGGGGSLEVDLTLLCFPGVGVSCTEFQLRTLALNKQERP